MYFGELKQKSVEYQCGFESGVSRAYSDAVNALYSLPLSCFRGFTTRQRLASRKHAAYLLLDAGVNYQLYVSTYGMGVTSDDSLASD